ncbi:MAG: hypothetical protein N2256_04775 [Tepidimonas ignava]|nr:hypothetical protein [Tepidimonas ignava]
MFEFTLTCPRGFWRIGGVDRRFDAYRDPEVVAELKAEYAHRRARQRRGVRHGRAAVR